LSPTVDAIVVPAARPGQHAREHIQLAESLGCTLVVLCSQAMTADAIVEIAARPRIPVVAIDFDSDTSPLGKDVFGTSELVVGTPFWHDTEVHAKRNAALLLAQFAGWDRLFFLDDDVVIENPDDIRTAAGLLGEYAVTG